MPRASATPWPSSTRTRSILSGSGGGPTITTHITPSAIAIEDLCLTSAASSANNHSIGPVTYADGATGICRNHRCRSVRSRTCLAILNPQPSTERSGDGITKRHRRFVSADEMSPFVCPCQHGQRSDSAAVAAIRPTAASSTNEPVSRERATPRHGPLRTARGCHPLHSQPPVNPARRSPTITTGQRRMMSQIRPQS